MSVEAAIRSAAAARLELARVLPLRLSARPPVLLTPGQRVSQEVKCFSVGQRLMSRPISEITVRTVLASRPSTAVRSMPVMV